MAKAVKEWSPCFLVGEGCSDGSGSERQARFCQRQHGGDRFRHRDCVCPRRRARARQWPHAAGRRRSDRGDSVTVGGGRSWVRWRSESRKHGGSALPSPSGGRDSGEQFWHLRAEIVRGHCRRRMGPLLRGERAQRGAPRAGSICRRCGARTGAASSLFPAKARCRSQPR
jgi:hypothetical protein